MRKAVIYYTSFTKMLGGGEYLPLLLAAELQKSCRVTLALNWESDVEQAAMMLGVPLDFSNLEIAVLKPRLAILKKIDAILPVFTTWNLKKVAKDADIRISAANPVDFGRPAHHFVYLLRTFGDNAFMDYICGNTGRSGMSSAVQRVKTMFAETILRPLLGVRSTRSILADPRERIYSTSGYVQNKLEVFYGKFNGTVFHPPTTFTPNLSDGPRDPLKTVYIGQLLPNKRIEEIVKIVEKAREVSGSDITLAVAGPLRSTPYVDKLRRLASDRKWMTLTGPMYGDAKSAFLMSASYAIHTERDEAFGISVTEYLKSGIVPIVPDDGGTTEIVDSEHLTYHNTDEAAKILVRLVSEADFRRGAQRHCSMRAETFSMQSYRLRQTELLSEILKQ